MGGAKERRALTVLADLQLKGLVRHIGLSNVTPAQIAEARQITPIVCVQNQYNLAHRTDDALIADDEALGRRLRKRAHGNIRAPARAPGDYKRYRPLRKILRDRTADTVALAIGPEGGWTNLEFSAAEQAGFEEASLGSLILRTETAVTACLASLNYALNNDGK